MKLITCPAFRERSAVEIRYNPDRIGVRPDIYLYSTRSAFTFFRISDGKYLATVPYEDRDATFSLAEDVQFDVRYVGAGVAHYYQSFKRTFLNLYKHTTDLEIRFLAIPSLGMYMGVLEQSFRRSAQ